MKKIIGSILLTFLAAFGCGNLLNDARDAVSTDVYIAGYTTNSASLQVPCYWKNGERTDLPVIDSTKTGHAANSIFVADGDVYVAGYSENNIGINIPCYWKNGERTDLSMVDAAIDGSSARSIVVADGVVYISGETYKAGPTRVPCYWKNGVRQDIATLSQNTNIRVDGKDVYIGGLSSGGAPCYWKNDSVYDLLINYTSGDTLALEISEGILYVTGIDINTSPIIAYPCIWVNGVRTYELPLPEGTSPRGYPYSIFIDGGDRYVCGNTQINASAPRIACYWKNNRRIDLPVISTAQNSAAFSIAVTNGTVCIAGYSYNDSGVSVPSYWENDTRIDLPALDATKHGSARELFLYRR
jgi:hypothetical protein